jgi:hypothetical protein
LRGRETLRSELSLNVAAEGGSDTIKKAMTGFAHVLAAFLGFTATFLAQLTS